MDNRPCELEWSKTDLAPKSWLIHKADNLTLKDIGVELSDEDEGNSDDSSEYRNMRRSEVLSSKAMIFNRLANSNQLQGDDATKQKVTNRYLGAVKKSTKQKLARFYPKFYSIAIGGLEVDGLSDATEYIPKFGTSTNGRVTVDHIHLTYKNPLLSTHKTLDYELKDLNDLAQFELRFDSTTGFTSAILEVQFTIANETYLHRNKHDSD